MRKSHSQKALQWSKMLTEDSHILIPHMNLLCICNNLHPVWHFVNTALSDVRPRTLSSLTSVPGRASDTHTHTQVWLTPSIITVGTLPPTPLVYSHLPGPDIKVIMVLYLCIFQIKDKQDVTMRYGSQATQCNLTWHTLLPRPEDDVHHGCNFLHLVRFDISMKIPVF